MPTLIYFTGLHLKETLMIFLLLYFVEQGDLLIRKSKGNMFFLIVKLLFLSLSLFYFRTVLGVAALFTFFVAMVFHPSRKSAGTMRIIKIGLFCLVFSFFITSALKMEILENYNERVDNLSRKMSSYASKGNDYARYGKTSVFLPIILIAPFSFNG